MSTLSHTIYGWSETWSSQTLSKDRNHTIQLSYDKNQFAVIKYYGREPLNKPGNIYPAEPEGYMVIAHECTTMYSI